MLDMIALERLAKQLSFSSVMNICRNSDNLLLDTK